MLNSCLRRLYSKNVGLFEELDIEFNDKFNYLVGPNGCGKSSVFKCIAIIFNERQYETLRYGPESENWIDYLYHDKIYRIGMGRNWVKNYNVYRGRRGIRWVRPPREGNVITIIEPELEDKNLKICPLFIGAYRRIDYHRIKGMERENSPLEQRNNFRRNSVSNLEGINLPNVKQWMINRYFTLEMEWAEVQRRNWYWLMDNLSKIAPKGSSFNFVEIKKDLEPKFNLNGNVCYLEELSAGYQAFLSLIFYIFDWIEGVNEEDYDKYVENATGTVIIDELDIHMHPEWQLTIRETLDYFFPNLQFIISTHSPHMVATANSNELLIFEGISRKVKLKPSNKTYSGWTTDQILEELMGVKNLESKKYNLLLKRAFDCIEENNSTKLKEIIKEIKDITHPSDTVVSQLKIKLASMLTREN
jgi:energy-coupling factor transporter ATP-binding protein EcfA2